MKLGQNLYSEALLDADKVIELNPLSYLGYELKHAALRGVHRYDDAFEVSKIMLSKLDEPDPQIQRKPQTTQVPTRQVEDDLHFLQSYANNTSVLK